MATWAQIKEGLGHIRGQLVAGTAVTTEVLASVLAKLVVIADLAGRMEVEQNKMNVQLAIEI